MGRPRLPPAVCIGIKLTLRPGQDDDLLAFFANIPPAHRAAAVCRALRAGEMQIIQAGPAAEDDTLFDLAAHLLL